MRKNLDLVVQGVAEEPGSGTMDAHESSATRFSTSQMEPHFRMNLSPKQSALVDALRSNGVNSSPVTRTDIAEANQSLGKSASVPSWILHDDARRAGRGLFHVPEVTGGEAPVPTPVERVQTAPAPAVSTAPTPTMCDTTLAMTGGESTSLIPSKMGTYVPFGHFADLDRIVSSRLFYPCFVTGLSGNGKTCMIEQVCAKHKREFYRVNITCQTDEDDLLGGFRLINGETVWQDGPVVAAMKQGGILLLDEIDLASHAIMCLQPVLEGKGVFLKKIGQWVKPASGFQVFATANTKGKGDDTGKFVATSVLNEAFLDRFPVCVEQEYPSMSVEKKIIKKVMSSLDCLDADFANNLCKWSDMIRKCYFEDAVDEIVTTRRLVNICTAFSVFGDKRKAIEMGVTRFDDATKEAFVSMYEKIDAEVAEAVEAETAVDASEATRFNLTTSYDQKDVVKSMGAKWDAQGKTWFVTGDQYRDNPGAWDAFSPTAIMSENLEGTECPF